MRLEPPLVRKIGVVRRRDKPSPTPLAAIHHGREQHRVYHAP
jgi:hypothetical protein